ncbi:MAG: DUF4159 domain-containing protein [Proteobacteria bacterium]|nr:DUF4159 domain-containing protein [Pseudomonadota bacterium]
MLEIGAFAFATPWLLTALASLPVLWWLLRFTPPSPKSVRFPAIRLLFGLRSEDETPDTAPLWLIILRLLAAALLILGLAHPLLHPGANLTRQGPIVLVIDDGWAAARDWPARQAVADQAIIQADREGRAVIILTTAATERGAAPEASGLLRPEDARNAVTAIEPKPWATDRKAAAQAVQAIGVDSAAAIYWLSDGLDDEAVGELAGQLQRLGPLTVRVPDSTPRLLLPPEPGDSQFIVSVKRATGDGPAPATIRALGEDGRLIARQTLAFDPETATATATLDLPLELRNAVARLEIEGETTAGATALLDTRWRRRPVGLVSETPLDDGPNLLSELYYVERALLPFSDIRRGTVETLLDGKLAVIILPDGAPLEPAERQRLDTWASAGGLLLRFAGPRLAQDTDDQMVPVPLRRGGRTLGGAMLWTEPARLAPFDRESPFYDLNLPDDVTIYRQVLAEPSLTLGEKTWARLTDGTPLVTASRQGDGWLVLVHTTSNAAWSNLALSGLFVEMMQRVVSTSRGVAGAGLGDRLLAPLELIDGFGHPADAGPATRAISAGQFTETRVGPTTPPGLYGDASTRRALNFGPQAGPLAVLETLPSGVEKTGYARTEEFDFKPWLLAAALVLLLIDAIATLAMRGLLPRRRAAAAGIAVFATLAASLPGNEAQAQDTADAFALKATLDTQLAYVITGDAAIDTASLRGLVGLTETLNRRTAIEASTPIGVDLERNPIVFFPLIYWPVTARQAPLSPEATGRVNRYLATGGTILFDLQDPSSSGANTAVLQQLTRDIAIPPLTPVPPDHVLTKAFYLMQDFPGRWTGGQVWVERPGSSVNDGVSSIVIGGHDWASAWAVDDRGQAMFAVVPGGARQREMAYRFGVNLVMYTLTGNYKSDQVHVPAILERLGN